MWADPVGDLRVLLSDGPTDKLRANKAVIGVVNGTNAILKTFEFRRINNFAASGTLAPVGISIDGDIQKFTDFVSDNPDTGFFELSSPVDVNANVTATYYIQWFLDTELQNFLSQASMWLGFSSDYTIVGDGLKFAALKFGCSVAYGKLALKYAEDVAQETYRGQDSKDDKRMEVVSAYQKASSAFLKEATALRDDFYTRKGQSKAPLFGTISGNVRQPTRS